MRYFLLLALPETLLSSSIISTPRTTGLILFAGTFKGCRSSVLATVPGAIALTAITATTDNDLGMAAATMIEAAG